MPVVSTFAGTGTAGSSGYGGPANQAQVNGPRGMARDAAGNIYFADWSNSAIMKVDARTGILSIYVGGAPAVCGAATDAMGDGCLATEATLNKPYAVTFDNAGNMFISDTGNNLVRRVDAQTNIITKFAGGQTTPCATKTDTIGNGCPATQAFLSTPHGVAVDSAGNVYVGDSQKNEIRKIDATTNIITKFAGTGSSGYTGDGGPAATSKIANPAGLVFDGAHTLYFADQNNDLVRTVDISTGIISTIAGTPGSPASPGYDGDGGPALGAKLSLPTGVAVSPWGEIYIADYGNSAVRVIDAQGKISTFMGGPNAVLCTAQLDSLGNGCAPGQAKVTNPYDVTWDAAGSIYVSGFTDNEIRKISPTASFAATTVGASTTQPSIAKLTQDLNVASFDILTGVPDFSSTGVLSGCTLGAMNGAGTYCQIPVIFSPKLPGLRSVPVVLADGAGNRYTQGISGIGISPNVAFVPATVQTIVGAGLSGSTGVAVDSAGNLYIADTANNVVRYVDAQSGNAVVVAGSGSAGYSGDGGAATSASLSAPNGVAVDFSGNVYIADTGNHAIRKVAALNGSITTVAGNGTPGYGGDGAPAVAAQLNAPQSIVADDAGNLYIADTGNNSVRKLTLKTGIISAVAGTGSAGYSGDGSSAAGAALSQPTAVTLDSAGNLYIADSGNHAIRRVDARTGKIQTVAGSGIPGYAGDGGAATAATLSSPNGVGVDAAGSLYIADTGNNVVRFVSANDAIIHSIAGTAAAGYSGDGGLANAATFSAPSGIALDGAGNIFIADKGNNAVRKISAAIPPTVNFGGQNANTSSAPQTIAVVNTGNQPLIFAGVSIAPYFVQQSTGNDCAGSTTLAPGASCELSITFAPTDAGTVNGSVVLQNNALNQSPATQMIALTGAGTTAAAGLNLAGLAGAVAGSAQTITLSAEASGVLTPSYVGTVHFSSTDPKAVLPSDYTFSSADAGVHVFQGIVFKTAGQQTLTVTDTADNTLSASSNVIITAASAATVTTNAGNNQTIEAGSTFQTQFKVTVLDSYQNPVKGVPVMFTAPTSGASGTFPGGGTQATVETGDDGSATAPVFSANGTVGAYSVTASVANIETAAVFSVTNSNPDNKTSLVLTSDAAGQSKTYGTTIVLRATVSAINQGGGVPLGTVFFSDSGTAIGSASLDANGVATLSVNPPVGAHNYSASYPGSVDWGASQSDGAIGVSVTQAHLTIAINDATKVYGSPLPTFTSTVDGLVGGDTVGTSLTLSYSSTAQPSSGIGSYPVTATLSGTAAGNYNATITGGTLTVTPAELVVTGANVNKVYGDVVPGLTATISGFVGSDTAAIVTGNAVVTTTAQASSPVGTYPITVSLGDLCATNYTFRPSAGVLTITPAPLSVVAANATRSYGSPNPTFTGTIAGVVNGDELSVTYSSTAAISSAVGSYPITAAVSGTAIANYNVQQTPGTLTITQAGTTISVTSSSSTVNNGSSVTFTANLASMTSGVPTGTVSFYSDATKLSTVPVSAQGIAAYSTTGLAVGTHSITAVYSGDTNFTASTSPAVTVVATANPDYTISVNPTSITIPRGKSGAVVFTITPVNGYKGSITFGCTNLPANVTCRTMPAVLNADGSNTTMNGTLLIYADSTMTAAARPIGGTESPFLPALLSFPAVFGALLMTGGNGISQRRTKQIVFLLVLLAVIIGMVGCGGSAGSAGNAPSQGNLPQVGTGTITVTASGTGDVNHSAQIIVTIQ